MSSPARFVILQYRGPIASNPAPAAGIFEALRVLAVDLKEAFGILKFSWRSPRLGGCLSPEPPPDIKDPAAQFLVLVTCRDDKDQVELLARLKGEGRECKALLA
jgi:hypothetical protein